MPGISQGRPGRKVPIEGRDHSHYEALAVAERRCRGEGDCSPAGCCSKIAPPPLQRGGLAGPGLSPWSLSGPGGNGQDRGRGTNRLAERP
ncbi:hypothetical protein MATL_G00104360 [Megalops atlanticus]|uniref:Uncharacterized protein n=1 Tax=Megalops atlanticus TaxID=7932 RepID=A0A9D3PYQ8_MEGAT|nr:hypothetical protein MATL_G00104360 [Megalops atlanticus]